ncbi:MAG: hypothetical protein Q9O62_09575 [Ardenticatenia bacterium]|nr:hypothetical protein [Ardenticatenia bacterium]
MVQGRYTLPARPRGYFTVTRAWWLFPWACLWLLVLGGSAAHLWPQRPDGDTTALAEFQSVRARHPTASALGLLDVRHAFWYNAAGAGLGIWLLDRLLASGRPRHWREWRGALVRAGGLIWLVGWGWTQTAGWQGDLFLAPGQVAQIGEVVPLSVQFSGFVVPPAPAGPGRELRMALTVNGTPVEISTREPHRQGGWTLVPRWYGGMVTLGESAPLYFGASGTRAITLSGGQRMTVTVEVESLRVLTVPPRPARAAWYAVVRARYDPGHQVRLIGALGSVVAVMLWGGERLRPSATVG